MQIHYCALELCYRHYTITHHLAAAHPEESDQLYTSNLTAPIEWLEMAIRDLDDFLQLFPDHLQAQQVKQLLQGAIEATQPRTV